MLLGMAMVDAQVYELDGRGRRIKTGPKPRCTEEEWQNAGLNTRPGPTRQFPIRMNLRISEAEQEALGRLSEAAGEDRSEVIRRLIREADAK